MTDERDVGRRRRPAAGARRAGGRRAPVYRQLAAMPDVQAVAEFPFGDPAWELRYVYYSTVHWKRLVNGYSGGFPRSYNVRVALLAAVCRSIPRPRGGRFATLAPAT